MVMLHGVTEKHLEPVSVAILGIAQVGITSFRCVFHHVTPRFRIICIDEL